MLIRPQNTLAECSARLESVRGRIADAARTSGRSADCVTLLAISKGHTIAAVRQCADLGLADFGENYLQEALPKLAASRAFEPTLRWHFTGVLQANKTRPVAETFDWVHTIDRPRIAERLATQRAPDARRLRVCVQLRSDSDPRGGGCPRSQLDALCVAVASSPQLELRGLMFLPAAAASVSARAREFAGARHEFERLRVSHPTLDTLSMGMSDDFEAAIAAGSTMVRLGTALFGPRLAATRDGAAGEPERGPAP
jgi:PLP dependent protein